MEADFTFKKYGGRKYFFDTLIPTLWPWAVTLTLDFQGQILKMMYLRNGRADWNGTKGMWVDRMLDSHCDFALRPHPWPWPWIFKVNFWNNCNSQGLTLSIWLTCHRARSKNLCALQKFSCAQPIFVQALYKSLPTRRSLTAWRIYASPSLNVETTWNKFQCLAHCLIEVKKFIWLFNPF